MAEHPQGENDAAQNRLPRRYATELAVAPHVEPRWSEKVLLELRLQGVAGRTIAGVLAEVEAHVLDSGEDASSTFGDPAEYARSLRLTPDPAQEPHLDARTSLLTVAQILACFLVFAGANALGAGVPATITWGVAATAVLAVAGATALLRRVDRLLRLAVEAGWQFVLGLTTMMMLVMAPAALWRDTLATIDARLALVAGALCVVGAVLVEGRRSRDVADPVTSPFEDPTARPARAVTALRLSVPAVAALAAVGLYVLGRMTG